MSPEPVITAEKSKTVCQFYVIIKFQVTKNQNAKIYYHPIFEDFTLTYINVSPTTNLI
jgi:hypothetical protein